MMVEAENAVLPYVSRRKTGCLITLQSAAYLNANVQFSVDSGL